MSSVEDNREKLLDHDYDGIRELDNDLPRWWVWLFYATIAWGVLYLLYFHVLEIGYSSADQYRKEINPSFYRAQDLDAKYLGILPEYRSPYADLVPSTESEEEEEGSAIYFPLSRESDTTTYVALTDAVSTSSGEVMFKTHCASCHGKLGEGGIGPNLTDQYWLHGNEFSDIVKSVRYGYPTKGMVPWLGTLSANEILEVASYTYTIRGTNPPNPKDPQGEPVTE